LDGFVLAAGCETFAVNSAGEVYDLLTDLPATQTTVSGYPAVYNKVDGTRLIHRLVGETFLPSPKKPEEVVINHINGDKSDSSVGNLEWTCYSGNLRHAYESGLRTDNLVVEVMDLRDSTVTTFNSLQAAARHFKRNGEAIHRYLKGGRKEPFMEFFSLRVEGEPWPCLAREDIGTPRRGRPKAVLAIPVDEGDVKYIYPTLTACAEAFNRSGAVINKAIKRGRKYILNGYWFTYLHTAGIDTTGFVEVEAKENPKPTAPVRKPLPVRVINLKTDTSEVYKSILEFATSVGATKAAVARSVWKNHGRWKHYHITYLGKHPKSP
jgi:hypothetical protein